MKPDELTPRERAAVEIMRLNDQAPAREIRWRRRVGGLLVSFEWRSSQGFWGRFGGGWQWAVGFQAAGRTIIFRLLICSVTVTWEGRRPKGEGHSWIS